MNQKRQQELITQLAEICEELEWVVGLPKEDDDKMVPGLIIGEEAFVMQVVAAYTDDYEVYAKDSATDGMHEVPPKQEEIPSATPKKKPTFH